ncbi:unnamed protein product [Allacma fusca]|uniref:Uncharacterized protein n=1 Tax=Allacma fusca TaxID=39272 RepID=A0A8J2L9X0_9HEXA|nr:unnamed protein product [Allacma fusca]
MDFHIYGVVAITKGYYEIGFLESVALAAYCTNLQWKDCLPKIKCIDPVLDLGFLCSNFTQVCTIQLGSIIFHVCINRSYAYTTFHSPEGF